jgi:pimeloyl-ACP methyl ester carboxylesterase
MTKPVTRAETLVTDDGVPIEAVHLAGDRSLGIVVAHGFTQDWQAPGVRKVAKRLNRFGGVIVFDFRGHGRSGGKSTLGDREINDLDMAIRYARELGYQRIVTIGFSMGASIVLRHAALIGGPDAVVSVSCPGRWYYRETLPMRRVHFAVEHRLGRLAAKAFLNTRISHRRWDPVPMPPAEAAARVAPTPLLIVHGDKDNFFPVEHAEQLFEAAHQPKELWIVPGYGHAETAAPPALMDRVGKWAQAAAAVPAGPQPVIAPDIVALPVAEGG